MKYKGLALLIVFCFIVVTAVAGNRNSAFSSGSHVKSGSGSRFSNGGIVANGVGNGTGSGGGNGGSGTGIDNGSSNAGGQGNGGGASVPIGSGLWILLVGSAFYLGRRVYIDNKNPIT